ACLADDAPVGVREATVAALLDEFHCTILPAPRVKYASFLIFFALALSPPDRQAYFDLLLDTLDNLTLPIRCREQSCEFLGGFVARAEFVDSATAFVVCKILLEWSIVYLQQMRRRRSVTRKQGMNGTSHRKDTSADDNDREE